MLQALNIMEVHHINKLLDLLSKNLGLQIQKTESKEVIEVTLED